MIQTDFFDILACFITDLFSIVKYADTMHGSRDIARDEAQGQLPCLYGPN
jgi:hypothetical protein